MSQENTNTKETKKDSVESAFDTPSDVLSQESIVARNLGIKASITYTFEEYEDDWGYHIPKGRYRFDFKGDFIYLGDEEYYEGWS